MKRFLILLLLGAMLLSLAACGESYKSRTAEFYGSINKTSFWYRGEVTSGTTVYTYTQAVDADSCTTIEDHEKDSEDGYVIYDGKYLHQLNLSSKKYDTLETNNGVEFLFGKNDYSEFNYPEITTDAAILDGKTYYCETFKVIDENGNETGENKYYFTDNRLVAVQWVSDGEVTATLRIEDYSETIPEDIYTSVPENFKAGTFTTEQVLDPSEVFGE